MGGELRTGKKMEYETGVQIAPKKIEGEFKEFGAGFKDIGKISPQLRYGAIKVGRKTIPFESQILSKKIFEGDGTTIFRTSAVTKSRQPSISLSKDIVRDIPEDSVIGDLFSNRGLKYGVSEKSKSLLFPKGATKAIAKE